MATNPTASGPTTGTPPANNPAFQANVEGKLISTRMVDGLRVDDYGDHQVVTDTKGRREPIVYSGQYSTPEQKALARAKGVRLTQQHHGTFGTQHRNDPTSGLYNKTNGQDFDWQDFEARHGSFIAEKYNGGLPAFIAAIKDPTQSKVATTWFQQSVNDELIKQGRAPYFKGVGDKDPNQIDGKFGINTFSVPSFYQQPASAEPPAKKEKLPDVGAPMDPSETPGKTGKWWQQDVVNLTAAITDKVNRYNPMLQQVDYQVPDYSLLDPARQIAAIQEGAGQYQDLVMNTADGQVARANVLGASGEAAGQVANIIGQYENQNVGIANAAGSAAASIYNQETDANTRYLDKFVAESATVNQNYDNAMRDKKYRTVDAFNQGTTNSQHQTQLEQMFPQVKVDRNSGQMIFSGNGKTFNDEVDGYNATTADATFDQTAENFQKGLALAEKRGLTGTAATELAKYLAGEASKTTRAATPRTKAGQAQQMRQGMSSVGSKYHLGGEVLPDFPQIGF